MQLRLALTILAASAAIHPVLLAQTEPAPRAPKGVYPKDDISSDIASMPGLTTAQYDSYFNNLFQSYLADPAVFGLVLQIHWGSIQPGTNADARFTSTIRALYHRLTASPAGRCWEPFDGVQTPSGVMVSLP